MRQAQDRFSPRKLAVITYTDIATREIKTTTVLNPKLSSEQGGVYAVIEHSTGKLMLESQHLHVYEEKLWNRADYTDDLAQADLDGFFEEAEGAEDGIDHHRLASGRW